MAMRVTTNMAMNLYRYNLGNSNYKMNNSMNKVSTQRRFDSFVEDPTSAVQAWRIRRAMVDNANYQDNNKDTVNRFNVAFATMGMVTNKLVDEAKAEKLDISARYNKFAEAEAYFIDHAFIIPFAVKNDGYCVNLVSPFDRPFAPFGVSSLKYKGAKLLDKPMNLEEYQAAAEQWDKEREAALAAQ